MKVKRDENSNKFCGPAALSLITGKHVDVCVQEVQDYRSHYGFLSGFRRKAVKGMSNWEMTWILVQRMGFQQKKLNLPKKNPTLVALVRWLKRGDWDAKKVYLINVTGHYVVMRGIKLFDNKNPEGIFFGKYDHRRFRVQHVWEVKRRAAPRTSCPVPSESSHQPAAC